MNNLKVQHERKCGYQLNLHVSVRDFKIPKLYIHPIKLSLVPCYRINYVYCSR